MNRIQGSGAGRPGLREMLLAWIRPGSPRSPCRITSRRLESQVTNLMDMATRYGTRPRSRTMMVGRLRNPFWFLRSLASPPNCRGLEVHDLHRQTCAKPVPGGYEDPRRGPRVVRTLLDRAVNVRTRGATNGEGQARGGARGMDGRSTARGEESCGSSAARIRTTSVQGKLSGSATSCP